MAKPTALFFIAAALLIIVTASLVLGRFSKQELSDGHATVIIHSGTGEQVRVKAEIADSSEEIERGLMFRKSLGEKEGMLFIYPEAAVVNFWMKNTLIPLDMIFIAENMTVAKIHYAVPCGEEPCKLYSSEQRVKYVLETNSNFTYSRGIKEGNKAVIKS